MRNFKGKYNIKGQKKTTKRLCFAKFLPNFAQIDKIPRCRDVINIPEKTEVGASLIFVGKVNASSYSDSDVNTTNAFN